MRTTLVAAAVTAVAALAMAGPASATIKIHATGGSSNLPFGKQVSQNAAGAFNSTWGHVQGQYNARLSNALVENTLCPYLATGGYYAGTAASIATFVAGYSPGVVFYVNCKGRTFIIRP